MPQLSSTTHLQPGKNLANTLLAWLDQGVEPIKFEAATPSDAKTAPAPTQSIEAMTKDELYSEFKARCKTNGVKASEKFKELMGNQLQEGITFVDLDIDKARWLVLELPLF